MSYTTGFDLDKLLQNRHIFIQLVIMIYDLLLISNIDMKDVQILVQLYVSFYYIFFYFT